MPDVFLDAEAIRAGTFVRRVEIYDTLGSTNDRAAELARDRDLELPALVATRHQTAGRGRGKNVWRSAEGALTFSVLLDPAALGISTASWPQLSLATAVAVCDALANEFELASSNPKSEIRNPKSIGLAVKWPNDVILNNRKVCGILIESPGGAAPAKNRLIVGIGINVNNAWHCAAPEFDFPAISCCEVSDSLHDLQVVLIAMLKAAEQRLVQLAAADVRLPQAWQRLCWLSQHRVRVESNGSMIEGKCLRIAPDGALLVETNSEIRHIYGGTVDLA